MKLLTLGWLAGYACAAVLSTTPSIPLETVSADSTLPEPEKSLAPVRNANHIFNAIRGAMRQWDSSWNHNGMSFFLAEVPQRVQFYHGTGQEEPITEMEWLAFEPEHAMIFARGRGPRGGPGRGRKGKQGGSPPPDTPKAQGHYRGDGQPPPPPDLPGRMHDCDQLRPLSSPGPPEPRGKAGQALTQSELGHRDEQHILASPSRGPPDEDFNATGYLHFYRSLHPLNLLYIDGMSAGKTSKGTLDSQDYILRLGLNDTQTSPFGDFDRAQALCNVSRDAWNNKIDGFLRMEAGFEIILCNFSAHLQFERAQVVRNDNSSGHGWSTGFRFYRAVSDRFHGIGGGRVIVDFDNIVTAFSSEADLFVNDTTLPGEVLPRLQNYSTSQLLALQASVTHMVTDPAPKTSDNWQDIAEMFVQRYAAPLQYLILPDLSDEDFGFELSSLLRPFISDATKDAELATQRCVGQFVPITWQETLAGQAIQQIGYKLCSTLLTSLFEITAPTANSVVYRSARTNVRELITYLDWPIWRECNPSCAFNELCIIPIWPMTANIEDRKQPRCKNETVFDSEGSRRRNREDNYWFEPGDQSPGGPPQL